MEGLNDHQKEVIRTALADQFRKLIGIRYEFGAEWIDYTKLPEVIDCSEAVEGVFKICGLKMPDGAQNQFNYTIPVTGAVQPGDLAFFGKGKDITQIYHVGMVLDLVNIIEARGFQPESSFETGKVILRNKVSWENFKNFAGYRIHPKLL